MDDFLNIHIDIVSLFELEIKRKTKKKIERRNWDKENEEKITNIDIDLLVISDVIILLMKKKK